MASVYPVEEVYEQSVDILAALGSNLTHHFGELEGAREFVPNSYLWVPTSGRDNKKAIPRGGAMEDRTLFGTEERFEIHCWGETRAAAYAMRQNAVVAMVQAIGGPGPLHYDGSEWSGKDENETTIGHVLIARFWIDSTIPNTFIPVERFVVKTPQSIESPEPPYTIPSSIEIQTYTTPKTSQPGTLVATDTIEEP